MKIFAIADLHLGFSVSKPMSVFGDVWLDHEEKIQKNWIETVGEDDLVILPGDISWGMDKTDSDADFEWIHRLPGKKVFIKGNHDYWWTSPNKLNKMYDDMFFLQNVHYRAENVAICGSRGWMLKEFSDEWTDHDEKIYKRELMRLRRSIESARNAGIEDIIAATHYPPLGRNCMQSGFTDIFEEFGIKTVIYGHLHGAAAHKNAFQGTARGVKYILVACDSVNFSPVFLCETE